MSRKATDTRERIIGTAANLFSRYGFTATSVDDVITAVGITKGAFYHYFNSKDHLCQTVLDQAEASYRQLAESFSGQEPSDDLLSRWFTRLIELQTSGQWICDRLIGRLTVESGNLNTDLQVRLRSFWEWFRSFYESLIHRTLAARAAVSVEQSSALAELFTTVHFGAVWLDRCAPVQDGLTTVLERLLRLTLGST